MDDQHRFDFLGSAGADFVSTPSLDRLASMGTRFSNCFTNCPLCAPARIALATGMQPFHVGSLDNQSFLPLSVPTFYQRFRDHGYRVGCVGKLDLAKPDPYNGRYGDRPCTYSWGFTHPEECEGKMHAGVHKEPVGPYTWYLKEKGLLQKFYEDYNVRSASGWRVGAEHDSVLDTEDFEDGYIGRRAAEWIEHIPDDFPWFYFVSFVGPHDPFDPPTEFADKYRNATMPEAVKDSMEGKPKWIRDRFVTDDPDKIALTRRQYCAAIETIDARIGMILDALEKRGQLDNTYIIFSSDHGDMTGDHGIYHKHVAYEPSLHVPLIISGPGIESGRVSDTLVELIDLNPTACELAGVGLQENIDARSLLPVLQGDVESHRENIISCERNFRCIRTQQHKYIENYNDIPELYDLEADPKEVTNIAASESGKVREFYEAMKNRYREAECLR